jgi:hypothetical protein
MGDMVVNAVSGGSRANNSVKLACWEDLASKMKNALMVDCPEFRHFDVWVAGGKRKIGGDSSADSSTSSAVSSSAAGKNPAAGTDGAAGKTTKLELTSSPRGWQDSCYWDRSRGDFSPSAFFDSASYAFHHKDKGTLRGNPKTQNEGKDSNY